MFPCENIYTNTTSGFVDLQYRNFKDIITLYNSLNLIINKKIKHLNENEELFVQNILHRDEELYLEIETKNEIIYNLRVRIFCCILIT